MCALQIFCIIIIITEPLKTMVCNGLQVCVEYVIRDGLIYSGLGWHSVDFVRLLGKDSSGLYVLKVGEEHIGILVATM